MTIRSLVIYLVIIITQWPGQSRYTAVYHSIDWPCEQANNSVVVDIHYTQAWLCQIHLRAHHYIKIN